MSKVCSLCGKGPTSGNNVSHSKRRTRRRFMPNLVTKRGIKICTACLRTLAKPPRKKKSKQEQDSAKKEVKTENITAATQEKEVVQTPKEKSEKKSSSEE